VLDIFQAAFPTVNPDYGLYDLHPFSPRSFYSLDGFKQQMALW
jgi:hypothetical protein